jgi:septum formation protein
MIVQPEYPVILASLSPRRKELLEMLGLKFTVIPAHADETLLKHEDPIGHVRRLAREKGAVVKTDHPGHIVISADTVVVHRNRIMGKPADEHEAYRMLKMLSGARHKVITAFSIQFQELNIDLTEHEVTLVRFRELSEKDIRDYIASGSPLDKAGAYGIQDLNAYLVTSIKGSYHNVIGFPVAKFACEWNDLFAKKER